AEWNWKCKYSGSNSFISFALQLHYFKYGERSFFNIFLMKFSRVRIDRFTDIQNDRIGLSGMAMKKTKNKSR
ncbi:MAG TPA: hypothetical protein PLU73_12645, partial [Bacteroidia bacterium]|nr:hypothetical protein [Bacteroidia bacterium]